MRKSYFSIVCLAVLAASLLALNPIATAQDQSFKTPEEAITLYLQAVAEGDVAKLLQACAVDEMSENFSLDLQTERIKALMLQSPAPSDYPFYAEINKAQFT